MYQDSSQSESSQEDPENPNFPGFSTWYRVKYCCTKNAVVVDNLPDTIFLGHWDAHIAFPIAVSTIIITSYLVGMILIFPMWKPPIAYISAALFSCLFFLFIYSYFRVIIDGPGYLPFYWPLKHNRIANDDSTENSFLIKNDELSPSGIISNSKQIAWTKSRQRPGRSILSKDGHRIILRPDHFCGWTASWIGKRNYKFFLLFNFYGAIYIGFFLVSCVIQISREMQKDMPSPVVVIFFLYAFLGLTFFILTFSFQCTHSCQMFTNRTNWEQWKGIEASKYNEGIKNNISDVCGPWNKWYTFLLPISPWTEYTNDELARQYSPYFSSKY